MVTALESSTVLASEPTLDDLERIRTRKPSSPVLTVDLKNGEQEKVWCTFSPQQIDINVSSEQGMQRLPFLNAFAAFACAALPFHTSS